MTVKTPVGDIKTETIITLLVGAILIPSTGWLLTQVLNTNTEMVKLQANMNALQQQFLSHCTEDKSYRSSHSEWSQNQMGMLNSTINRMDRNLVRICEKTGVEYEQPH